jgi:hypothetical protein
MAVKMMEKIIFVTTELMNFKMMRSNKTHTAIAMREPFLA